MVCNTGNYYADLVSYKRTNNEITGKGYFCIFEIFYLTPYTIASANTLYSVIEKGFLFTIYLVIW